MSQKLFVKTWKVQGRNGYYGVDQYHEGKCERFVGGYKTRKNAESAASSCGSSYYVGIRDAHIGFTLPLVFTVAGRSGESKIDACTLVKVLERRGGLFTVETSSGQRSGYVSLTDLRGE